MKPWADLTDDERDRIGAYFSAVEDSRDFGAVLYAATNAPEWYAAALDEMLPKGNQNAVSPSEFGNFLAEELHNLSDDWMQQPSSMLSRHQVAIEIEQNQSELRNLIAVQPF